MRIVIDSKNGYVDERGTLCIQPIFPACQDAFSTDLAWAIDGTNGKYGYIDESGSFVIPPQYENAGEYAEGLAPVVAGGLWGYIGATGDMVIPPTYDGATRFRNGLAIVYKKGAIKRAMDRHADIGLAAMIYVIDRWGREVAGPIEDASALPAGMLYEPYAQPALGGYQSHSAIGGIPIGPIFDAIVPFVDGLGAGWRDGAWEVIDTRGITTVVGEYDVFELRGHGIAWVARGYHGSLIQLHDGSILWTTPTKQ